MAADDITSQDAAVIGDDLVEALGFEPITADAGSGEEQREGSSSEVAVLDDTSVEDRGLDERTLDGSSLDRPPGGEQLVEPPSGDDIEIIEDEPDHEIAVDEIAVEDEAAVDEAAVDEIAVEDEPVADEAPAEVERETIEPDVSDLGAPDLETELEGTDLEVESSPGPDLDVADLDVGDVHVGEDEATDLDLPEQAETSLFGAPAPAYVWGKRTSDDETDKAAVDEAAVDEAAVDEAADASDDESSPVVFFNNAVDADTAPLSDLDLDSSDLDSSDLDSSDLEDEALDLDLDSDVLDEPVLDEPDLDEPALDEPELDEPVAEIDLSDPPPPVVTNLIDLDRGDDLAVGDEIADEDTVALPLQRPALDLPTDRDRDLDLKPEPQTEQALETAETQVEPVSVPSKGRRQKLRARKSRRVVRHIDPWSVLTFSVLFHLCFFAALLLASVLVWNAALAAGTIENIENFVRELGDYETFEINSDQVFRAATLIAGLLTLASSVLVVLLTVVFNLISDLIGGIRVTVIEEETVRIPGKSKK